MSMLQQKKDQSISDACLTPCYGCGGSSPSTDSPTAVLFIISSPADALPANNTLDSGCTLSIQAPGNKHLWSLIFQSRLFS